MTAIEDRLQAIEDREEIRELTARYCHAIAAADVAKIVSLFCKDGSFCTNDQVMTGTIALTKFYSSLSGTPPIPFIQNHVIDELNESEARARCSAEIRLVQNGESVTGAGWYADTYRRVEGQWKFLERRFHIFHMVPLSKGWAS
jgi:ketosteroid isomerase-like protein